MEMGAGTLFSAVAGDSQSEKGTTNQQAAIIAHPSEYFKDLEFIFAARYSYLVSSKDKSEISFLSENSNADFEASACELPATISQLDSQSEKPSLCK
jgi:hypothetical protein